jgi:hypothetical protein
MEGDDRLEFEVFSGDGPLKGYSHVRLYLPGEQVYLLANPRGKVVASCLRRAGRSSASEGLSPEDVAAVDAFKEIVYPRYRLRDGVARGGALVKVEEQKIDSLGKGTT